MHFKRIVVAGFIVGTSVVAAKDYLFVKNHYGYCSESVRQNDYKAHCVSPSKMKLLSVQVFFRHGARLPITYLPGFDDVDYDNDFVMRPAFHTDIDVKVTDLNGNSRPHSFIEDFYQKHKMKNGRVGGELTALGRDQAYMLGKKLRRRYIENFNLLDSIFDPEQIYIRSTNINRSVLSAQCVLAGLYSRDGFKSTPVIEVALENEEILYPNTRNCQTLEKFMKYNRYALIQSFAKLRQSINAKMGWDETVRYDLMNVFDHLSVRKLYDLPLDNFFKQIENQIVESAVKTIRSQMAGTEWTEHHILKMSVGQVLHMIGHNMNAAVARSSKRRLCLFSCHDSSLVALLVGISCFDNLWPPYCADLCLELYEDNDKNHWVKVVYCDKELTPVGCNGPVIAYKDFQELLDKHSVDSNNYKSMCSDDKLRQASLLGLKERLFLKLLTRDTAPQSTTNSSWC